MPAARTRHLPAGVRLCNGAAMKRRLIEQACGCSVVGGGGGREVRARLCLMDGGVGVVSTSTLR